MLKQITFKVIGLLLIIGGWEINQLSESIFDILTGSEFAVYAWQQIAYLVMVVGGLSSIQYGDKL